MGDHNRLSRLPKGGGAVVVATAMLVLAGLHDSASADVASSFPVVVHVGVKDGAPVVDDAFVAHRIALASRHFAPAGVCFRVEETRLLANGHYELQTIPDRRRLSRLAVRGKINVFVFERILDATPSAATVRASRRVGREPSGQISGGHIPWPGGAPATYIITARASSELSITHELGHFFGAPHHADPLNIMSYGPARERFDDGQLATFRAFARRHARRRTVTGIVREGCPPPA